MSRREVVAGVDGCPGGWLVVIRPVADPGASRVRLCTRFADVLALEERPLFFAVDMPIGLPARSGSGGRAGDAAARAVLGARQSSVFAVPSRDAVQCTTYEEACRVALATSDPPRKVAKQTFHLFAKIRELDALVDPAVQQRVRECHPEVAFWALAGERSLAEPKKIKSRPHPAGVSLRSGLLAKAGYDPAALLGREPARSLAGDDDVLDAAAASWTAWRLACGAARSLPAVPPLDPRGLAMAIWY